MTFVRTKIIKGNAYNYLQSSTKVGGRVKSKTIAYLGPASSGLGTTNSGTRSIDTFPLKDNEFEDTKKKESQLRDQEITGAKLDKRPKSILARDMQTNAKKLTNDPDVWKDKKGRTDLRGWDTTHIKDHIEKHAKEFPKIHKKLESKTKNAYVLGRVKLLDSLADKVRIKNKSEEFSHKDATDVNGFMVVCDNIECLKGNMSTIKNNFNIIEKEVHDGSNKGYRATHLLVKQPGGTIAEIQIKTKRQKQWAEWGHDRLYKDQHKTKKLVGEDGFKQAQDYSLAMSDYYHTLDNGLTAIKPKAPQIVKEKLGEMP